MVPFETLTFLEILDAPREVETGFAFNSFTSLTNGIFDTVRITITKLQFLIFATMTPIEPKNNKQYGLALNQLIHCVKNK